MLTKEQALEKITKEIENEKNKKDKVIILTKEEVYTKLAYIAMFSSFAHEIYIDSMRAKKVNAERFGN
jgi:putative heme iron utilization protein